MVKDRGDNEIVQIDDTPDVQNLRADKRQNGNSTQNDIDSELAKIFGQEDQSSTPPYASFFSFLLTATHHLSH